MHKPLRYRRQLARAGTSLAAGSMLIAPFILFLALPPFQTGVWFQSEPVAAGLHLITACASAGLVLAALGGSRLLVAALYHPLVLIPLGLATWSLVAGLAWSDLPYLSWFGTPQQGEGIAWYLDLSILTVAARVAWRLPRLRKWAGWCAVVGLSAAAILCLPGEVKRTWSLYRFQDYFAFHGIFTFLVAATFLQPRSRLAWGAVILLCAFSVTISENRAAIAICVVAAIASAAVIWICRKRYRLSLGMLLAGVIVFPVTVLYATHYLGHGAVGSSTWSRALHYDVALDALVTEPIKLVTGYGWGHYADLLNTYLPVDKINFVAVHGAIANWDAVSGKSHYHSHHFLIEALLSAGLVGLILAWLYPIAMLLSARRSARNLAAPIALIVAGLTSVWFQLSGSIPLMAMAAAGAGAWSSFSLLGRHRHWVTILSGLICVMAFAACLLSAQAIYRFGEFANRAAEENQRVPDTIKFDPEDSCPSLLPADPRGGVHLAELFMDYIAALQTKTAAGGSITTAEMDRLDAYLCLINQQELSGSSIRLQTASLNARADLAFTVPGSDQSPTVERFLAIWPTQISRFLSYATGRGDVAWKYFTHALNHGGDQTVLAITSQMLERDPDDPVGLWYHGLTILADPDQRAQGFKQMNLALDNGLDRIMPISESDRDLIRANR